MKIILSRKGFDSSYGGVPSPIFPDGICSLPIPEEQPGKRTHGITYANIRYRGANLGDIVAQLTKGKTTADKPAHLDPDLRDDALSRETDWQPCFGQCDAAQEHLANQNVGKDDLFLFFGWFRRVEKTLDAWRVVRGEPGIHVIWGWLQVGEVYNDRVGAWPSWAEYHPHHPHWNRPVDRNTLYVAKPYLTFPGLPSDVPGGGVFRTFHERLRLTAKEKRCSIWFLPSWFHPDAGKGSLLSYHKKRHRWGARTPRGVELHSVSRGQEFLLDLDSDERKRGAGEWLAAIFQSVDR